MLQYTNAAGFADTNARKMMCPLRSVMARPCRLWNDQLTRKQPFTIRSNIASLLILLPILTRLYIFSRVAWVREYLQCRWPSAMPALLSVFLPHSLSVRSAHIAFIYWSSLLIIYAGGYKHPAWASLMWPRQPSSLGQSLFKNMPDLLSKF